MTRTPPARWHLFACALLAALLGACGSTGAKPGESVRIRYVNYLAQPRVDLALVNPAHSDRLELYSSTRKVEESGTKVSTDEVLEETLKYLEQQGFYDKAQEGSAPGDGGGKYSQALEVETPARRVHLAFHRGLPPADQQVFKICAQAFLEIYNSTYQLQSVDRLPEWEGTSSSPPAGSQPKASPKKSQG